MIKVQVSSLKFPLILFSPWRWLVASATTKLSTRVADQLLVSFQIFLLIFNF
jgi:hypothetical protein